MRFLVAAHPEPFDLERLVEMDYLVVHSGDADGPDSLHAPLPMRAGELLVRRGLIEKGLLLMMSRSLVQRIPAKKGFNYLAGEGCLSFSYFAHGFLFPEAKGTRVCGLPSGSQMCLRRMFGELRTGCLRTGPVSFRSSTHPEVDNDYWLPPAAKGRLHGTAKAVRPFIQLRRKCHLWGIRYG